MQTHLLNAGKALSRRLAVPSSGYPSFVQKNSIAWSRSAMPKLIYHLRKPNSLSRQWITQFWLSNLTISTFDWVRFVPLNSTLCFRCAALLFPAYFRFIFRYFFHTSLLTFSLFSNFVCSLFHSSNYHHTSFDDALALVVWLSARISFRKRARV